MPTWTSTMLSPGAKWSRSGCVGTAASQYFSGCLRRTCSNFWRSRPKTPQPVQELTVPLTVTFTYYLFLLFFAMAVSLTSINVTAERHKRLRVFECLRSMSSDLFLLLRNWLHIQIWSLCWEETNKNKQWPGIWCCHEFDEWHVSTGIPLVCRQFLQ